MTINAYRVVRLRHQKKKKKDARTLDRWKQRNFEFALPGCQHDHVRCAEDATDGSSQP
jgi:hypothetical protein